MALSSCQTTGPGNCPPLVTYSRAFQAAAADELNRLPADSKVKQLVNDYGKTRDACRAAK